MGSFDTWSGFAVWAGEELARIETAWGINNEKGKLRCLPAFDQVQAAEDAFIQFIKQVGVPLKDIHARGRFLGGKYGFPSKNHWLSSAEIQRYYGKTYEDISNRVLVAFCTAYEVDFGVLQRFLKRSVVAAQFRQIAAVVHQHRAMKDMGERLAKDWKQKDPGSYNRILRDSGLDKAPQHIQSETIASVAFQLIAAGPTQRHWFGDSPETAWGFLLDGLPNIQLSVVRASMDDSVMRKTVRAKHALDFPVLFPEGNGGNLLIRMVTEAPTNAPGPIMLALHGLGFIPVDEGFSALVDEFITKFKANTLLQITSSHFLDEIVRTVINYGIAEGICQRLGEIEKGELAKAVVQSYVFSHYHLFHSAGEEKQALYAESFGVRSLWLSSLRHGWPVLTELLGDAERVNSHLETAYTLA